MNENGTKRRDWVKNAAIVFLSVLLVLTFFSNTILNYSLPEVAGQYIQSGTITSKIRGSGTIESGDLYNIQINETRTVESVMVRAGDEVTKGDILFLLADKESTELTTAEDQLDAAILEFEMKILSGDISNAVINNVQRNNISSVSQYQSRILAAEATIESWQKKVDEITTKISELEATINKLGYSTTDASEEAKKLYNAQSAYDRKNTELTTAKNYLSSLQSDLAKAQETIKYYENGLTVSGNDPADIQYAYSQRDKLPAMITEAQATVTNLQTELYNLNVEVEKAKAAHESKSGNTGSINSLKIELENWKLELHAKEGSLKEAQEAKTQLLTDIAQELSLDAQSDTIEKLRETVAELRAKAIGAAIEAPVSGIITSVLITAGADTVAGTPIATMQPEGKGYTMSFSVTNKQAQSLSVGAKADLVNAWYYNDVEVTLASIKPDTTDPGQKKLLTFHVTGSVTTGQSLSISVGDKSATYDMIVPNSAVREDNNGKFILVVESKESPLGTRYTATRVDVEELARDDTQAAISGALYGYGNEFVITTSTKLVEAGQQVRLANK